MRNSCDYLQKTKSSDRIGYQESKFGKENDHAEFPGQIDE